MQINQTAIQKLHEEAERASRQPPTTTGGKTRKPTTFSLAFEKALKEHYYGKPRCPNCNHTAPPFGGPYCECAAGQRWREMHQRWAEADKQAEEEAAKRRVEKAWGALEIPPEFSNLPSIQTAFGRAVANEKDKAIRAAISIVEGTAKNTLKVFHGPVGTGKSALCARIAETLGYGLFITMTGFLDELLGSSFEDKLTKMRAAQTCPLLILDDLCNPEPEVQRNGKGWDVKRLTQWQREKLLELLDYRIKWHLPTLITTNLTGELNTVEVYLQQQLDERLADRLMHQFDWVEMGGANLRRAPRKGV